MALHGIGRAMHFQGDPEGAIHHQESLALQREHGIRTDLFTSTLGNLSLLRLHRGDVEEARRLSEEAVAHDRATGDDVHLSIALQELGWILGTIGALDRAEAAYAEGLRLAVAFDHQRMLPSYLEGYASIALGRGQPVRATRLFAAGAALREAMGYPVRPEFQDRYARIVEELRMDLGAEAFADAWTVGRSRSIDAAIAEALNPTVSGGRSGVQA